MPHRNARLTVHGRRLLVHRVRTEGQPVAHVAKEMGISRQCAHRWVARYDAEGDAGLEDRSSRPHTTPAKTSPEIERRVLDPERVIEGERHDAQAPPQRLEEVEASLDLVPPRGVRRRASGVPQPGESSFSTTAAALSALRTPESQRHAARTGDSPVACSPFAGSLGGFWGDPRSQGRGNLSKDG